MKSAVPTKTRMTTSPYSQEHTIKGSKKTFRKEDIKLAGLRESSNLMQYI
jgi:hypothetical protein